MSHCIHVLSCIVYVLSHWIVFNVMELTSHKLVNWHSLSSVHQFQSFLNIFESGSVLWLLRPAVFHQRHQLGFSFRVQVAFWLRTEWRVLHMFNSFDDVWGTQTEQNCCKDLKRNSRYYKRPRTEPPNGGWGRMDGERVCLATFSSERWGRESISRDGTKEIFLGWWWVRVKTTRWYAW